MDAEGKNSLDPSLSDENGIAIVGIGCRFPGGADRPAKFWDLLKQGFDAVTEAPSGRSGLLELFDPDPGKPGRVYTRWGGFLDRVDLFDAHFFGISPREASRIDPQQRLLLELVWEACEDAGIPPSTLAGSRTAVLIGVSTHDYGDMQMYPANRNEIDLYSNSGSATSIVANRISYIYDLRGPSIAVDTACSSALTAVHLACQSISTGECQQAIVGGVQMFLTPELTIGFCKASMLSRDGKSRAFDVSANGYVRGEGGGIVILKPLRAALRDGDSIYAVIRSTCVNQDGHTNGMTVPSGDSQRAMLEEALQKAGLQARDVQYVEAHGTGTPVGDPIEATAIGAAMSRGRSLGDLCAMGSVKTNIGHLEAASGIAGLIKVALALKHRQIPPSLHFQASKDTLDLAALGLRIVTSLEPWPHAEKLAIAGVNSFGFGGANAHVLLQESPPRADARLKNLRENLEAPELLVLSARSSEALDSLALAYADYLAAPGSPALSDVCYTAAQHRDHHDHRVAVVAQNSTELAESLSAFASREGRINISAGRIASPEPPRIGFVFSGLGPEWWGMGRQLLQDEPAFLREMERCDQALRQCSDWHLIEELLAPEESSRVAAPEFSQVTNFAIQAALAATWASFGINPSAVIGHSGGAMAAAYVAGIHNLEDAIRLTYHRSRLMGRPTNEGRMLAVGVPWDEIAALVEQHSGEVWLAAVNGPSAITLGGYGPPLDQVFSELQERQIFARFLPGTIAYHGPAMDKIKDEFLASVADLRGVHARIPIVSDVTGAPADGAEYDAQYWWRSIRQPVLFAVGIQQMIADGIQHFVEIGPHPVLASSIADCMHAQGCRGLVLPSIRRKENERAAMLRSLGALYTVGCSPNWPAVQRVKGQLLSLPSYPWQRERHWFEPAAKVSSWVDSLERTTGEHPLLGARTRSARPSWESAVGTDRTAYLQDHVVQESIVFPGAAYVELALAANSAIEGQPGARLRDIEFLSPMVLTADGPTAIQVCVDTQKNDFEIFSSPRQDAVSWLCHARGTMEPAKGKFRATRDLQEIQSQVTATVDAQEFYARMAERGLRYGPAFRGVKNLWAVDGQALGEIAVAGLPDSEKYCIHPALLDAAFQLLVGAAEADVRLAAEKRLFLPVKIRELTLSRQPGDQFWACARLDTVADATVTGDIWIFDRDGKPCGEILGLAARLIETEASKSASSIDQWLYEYRWESKPRERTSIVKPTAAASSAGTDLQGIAGEVCRDASALAVNTGWVLYYSDVERRLNELATAYVVAAFSKLGCDWLPGSALDLPSFGARGWREPLLRQLVQMLEIAGLLRKSGEQWIVVETPLRYDAPQLASEILRDFPNHRSDVELLGRCGPRLSDVLAGQCDGRDILFHEEGLGFLEHFYSVAPASAFYNPLVASVVSRLAAAGSAAAPFRILEIGAGTGGTTSHILHQLEGRHVSYVFSDLSSVFLDRARSRFSAHPFLTTQLLDIAKEPLAQGFAAGSFDLIIGANVLHATPDLAKSATHIRELLAPGGELLLLEITRHPYWLDIVFGLMDGWWKFEDRSLRPQHPLLTRNKWTGLLATCGIEDVSIIADDVQSGEPAQSIMIGRRAADDAISHPAQGTLQEKFWLIFADRRGIGDKLAINLRARGFDAVLIHADEEYRRQAPALFGLRPGSSEDLALLLSDLSAILPQAAGIVHLWSIDTPDSSPAPLAHDAFAKSQELGCGSLLSIVRRVALASQLSRKSLIVVTSGAQSIAPGEEPALWQSAIWGLGRVVLKEMPELRCRMIDLSAGSEDSEIAAMANEIVSDDPAGAEEEIVLRSHERFVHRLRPTSLAQIADSLPAVPAKPEDGWRAEITASGSLDNLKFKRSERPDPGPHQIEVSIRAASLNFRDIVLAMGLVPGLESENTFGKKQIGSDFAGTVTRCGPEVIHLQEGDEVFGIASGTFAAYALTDAALVARRPSTLGLEQASCVPVAFVTAWYALKHLARLKAGETVLIHAASGGVGLAAIQIAHLLGATVFATAGSTAKRSYLGSLGIAHVFDSRSLAFAEEIRHRTQGRGVDVVLNSLAGEALQSGISLLAPYGRFVELGKSDIYQNHRVDLAPFKKNLSLFAVDLDRMTLEKPAEVGQMLQEVTEQLVSGSLQPLPFTSFQMDHLTDAMRFMAQAKHIGKVSLTNDAPIPLRRSVPDHPPVVNDATYLITGGLGGLGLVVARWLVERGAGALVLLGRSAASAEAQAAISELRKKGARVEISRGDVSHDQDVTRVLEFIRRELPPLRGIFHTAMVLEDTPLATLEREALDRVMAPKALGAWHLHEQTLSQPLDFFVSFSSITSLLGNHGQANYAAANAFLDSFASYRHARGLPATTINWGVISKAGYVARHQDVEEYLAKQGYLSFPSDRAIEVLSALMCRNAVQIMAARIDWKTLGEFAPQATSSHRIRHLVPAQTKSSPAATGHVRQSIENEEPAQRQSHVVKYLREQIGRLLGETSPESLESDRPLSELGVDSLIAAEVTVVLQRDLGVEVSGNRLLSGGDIQSLATNVLGLMRLDSPKEPVRTPPPPAQVAPPPKPAASSKVSNGIPRAQKISTGEVRVNDVAPIPATVAVPRPPAVDPLSRNVASMASTTPKPHNSTGVDYASLNYSRWSPSQKLVRGAAAVGFRLFSQIDSQGFENIPETTPCLLAVNHLSMTDVPLLLTLLRRRAVILASEKLRESRLLDWFVSDIGQAIYVSPNAVDGDSLHQALTVLQAGGMLALAPEGTRSRTGGLLRGRTGVAYLATQAHVPVVPVAAWGQEQWLGKMKRLRRIPIHVRAGAPLCFPAGPTSPQLLRQYTDQVMRALAALLPPQYRGVYAQTSVPITDNSLQEVRPAV